MFTRSTLAAAAALVAVAAAPAAQAQMPNFLGMDLTAMNNGWAAGQQRQMGGQMQQIMQSVLSNPQAIAAYRAGVCGHGLSPEQFAYKYAATGGCTAQGYAAYNGTSGQIARDEGAARQRYYGAVQDRQQAMAAMQQDQARIQYERGLQLGGWNHVYRPNGSYFWYR